GGKAHRSDVIGLLERRLVERLDVLQHVGVLVARSWKFVRCQGIEHEGVVRVRGVRELDFNGLFAGSEGCGCGSHGWSSLLWLRSAARPFGRETPLPCQEQPIGKGTQRRDVRGAEPDRKLPGKG